MNQMNQITGNTVVGRLSDCPGWEADLVMALRLWLEGAEGQTQLWTAYARSFGAATGRSKLKQFEALLRELLLHARRPLVRHGLACDCIGSDEAIVQTIVREAVRGDFEEARMIASLIVPARNADMVATYAAEVGKTLMTMSAKVAPSQPRATDATPILH